MQATSPTRTELVSAARRYRHAFATEHRAGARLDSLHHDVPEDTAERVRERYQAACVALSEAAEDLVFLLQEAGLQGLRCDGTLFIDANQDEDPDFDCERPPVLMVPLDRIG